MNASYENQYEERYEFERLLVRSRRNKIIERIEHEKPSHILEVGAGPEPIFKFIKNFDSYCLVEANSKFASEAKKAAEHHLSGPKIQVINDWLENFASTPVSLPKLDLIILSSVLHEVKEPKTFLEAIRKISNPSTRILVIVPNAESLHRLFAFEAGMMGDLLEISPEGKALHRQTSFTKSSLCALAEDCGFQVKTSETFFIKPLTSRQMTKLFSAKILDEQILLGLERASKYLPDYGAEVFVEIHPHSENARTHP